MSRTFILKDGVPGTLFFIEQSVVAEITGETKAGDVLVRVVLTRTWENGGWTPWRACKEGRCVLCSPLMAAKAVAITAL